MAFNSENISFIFKNSFDFLGNHISLLFDRNKFDAYLEEPDVSIESEDREKIYDMVDRFIDSERSESNDVITDDEIELKSGEKIKVMF